MNLCPLMHHFAIVLFLFHSYFRQRSLHNSPFEHANNDFKIVSLVFLKICPWWEGGFSCQWCHLADEWGVQTQALCVWHDPASPNHSAVSPPSYPIHMSRSNFHKSPSSLLCDWVNMKQGIFTLASFYGDRWIYGKMIISAWCSIPHLIWRFPAHPT